MDKAGIDGILLCAQGARFNRGESMKRRDDVEWIEISEETADKIRGFILANIGGK